MLMEDRTEARRWSGALTIVFLAHVAPVLIVAYRLGPVDSTPAPEPAILIDIGSSAPAPVPPSEQSPGLKQFKAELPQPKEQNDPIKMPPATNPAETVPVTSPQPLEIGTKEPAPQTVAPPVQPTPPALTHSSSQVTWQGLILSRLEKFKRYPSGAQSRRQQGVSYIRFVMDRNGRVLSSRLERSSGFSALDGEAVVLPERAQPLPIPPADVSGETIELLVPVEFFVANGR